jgi:GT2 family glycosyltransferase
MQTLARKRGMDMTLLFNENNVGAPSGRNQGMSAARGDAIVFLDNDVVVFQPDWIDKLRAVLFSEEDIGSVSPKLIYPNVPHWIQCAGCDVSPEGKVNFRGRGEPREHPVFNARQAVQSLISACMMTRAEVIRRIGPMDEAFNPVEYEDIDYSYRIKAAGFRLLYVPEVEVYHFENVTTEGSPRLNNRYLLVKNGLLFKKKWRHVFEKEDGPPASSMVWKEIPSVPLSEVMDVI